MENKLFLKLNQPIGLQPGYFCSMLLNTKGRGCPRYLIDYLKQISKDSGGVFNLSAIFDQTPNIEHWKEHRDIGGYVIKNTDTLIQLAFTLNLELSEKDFEDYSEGIISNDVLPFITGCNFDFMGMFLIYQTPPQYKNLGKIGGEHSVIIYSKGSGNTIQGVLKEVFSLTDDAIALADTYFNMVGWHRLENCITKQDLPKLEAWMNTLGIKYEVE